MDSYKVEKLTVESEFLLADGSTLEGSMYLAPLASNHAGPQTIPELIAEKEIAIPLHAKDGRFILVGKTSIVAVKRARIEAERAELSRRIPVNVSLLGGHSLKGDLIVEQGAAERLSDFLNLSGDWISLQEPERLVWFSKRSLASLEPRIP